MAQGTPVVTSRGTSTEEVARGAAVLVDPFDVDDIGVGGSYSKTMAAGAAELSWAAAAARTLDVYREAVS